MDFVWESPTIEEVRIEIGMSLSFRRFRREDYPEYAAWFSDPELNHYLGPMDEDWLSAILAQEDTNGITWAVFQNEEMIGVVEVVFDPRGIYPNVISGIAVKPNRRKQGIARAILDWVLKRPGDQSKMGFLAYIHKGNQAAKKLFEGAGFVAVSEPNEYGYVDYCHKLIP